MSNVFVHAFVSHRGLVSEAAVAPGCERWLPAASAFTGLSLLVHDL